ncbi:hypothetical protein V9K67_17235 [Paraflavisolibacter sp. H34]|uniref:hypothetical protein n=1 Tax=Huijunlia imazamoxiresistens TaxID=3127457 RepID=UPI00301808AC
MEKELRKKIARNAALSLFIYALPLLLMFLSFYLTGQRPWIKAGKPAAATTQNHQR